MLLANSPELRTNDAGYGPVAGVLQIAAATSAIDPWRSSMVPFASLLAACDGDVIAQDGQFYFEGARLAPDQSTWAASAWLERASHNAFNAFLGSDPFSDPGRLDCETLLAPDAQRRWLISYATDFLSVLFDEDVAAAARMGIDVGTPAPAELYDLPARVAYLARAANRQTLWLPAAGAELANHRLGGVVVADSVFTHFCPKGFYTPEMLPGSAPCRRNSVIVPGQPAHAVVSWERRGAALRFDLPPGVGDLSRFATLSLRAAVDPASPLNAAGQPQALSIRLTDRSGNSASVSTRTATRAGEGPEPALTFPLGFMKPDEPWEIFVGRVPLTTIRVPLARFADVNLADIAEVALVFDQTDSGTLFLADLEWVRP